MWQTEGLVTPRTEDNRTERNYDFNMFKDLKETDEERRHIMKNNKQTFYKLQKWKVNSLKWINLWINKKVIFL